jgi:hypothetical protein
MDEATLKAAIREKLTAVKTLAETVNGAAREFTEDEKSTISGYLNEVDKLNAQLAKAQGDATFRDSITGALAGLEDVKEINDAALKGSTPGFQPRPERLSIGEQFVNSPVYKNFLAEFPSGLPDSVSVKSAPVTVGGFKDLLTSGDLPGIINPEQRGLIIPPVWGRELDLLSVITSGTTSSDVIEYARLLSATNNAAPVAEAANYADGAISGASPGPYVVATPSGTKPFSTMVFEKVTTPVRNIAHGRRPAAHPHQQLPSLGPPGGGRGPGDER